MAVFYFSFSHFDDFLNTFAKNLMKTNRFHKEYQEFLELPTLSQRFEIQKFLTMKRWPFKDFMKIARKRVFSANFCQV